MAAKRKIIPNPALLEALVGFVPVFSDKQDLSIVNRLELISEKLRGVDNEVLRGIKKGASPRAFTTRMREIEAMERALIAEITSRKMDF